ncbi:MAG: hypothetical protein IPJ34_13090 [Myxococcales bacterium]|nr:hypothetical protein [Myxococcales bacterium]
MSATLSTRGPWRVFLGDPPLVTSEGRAFPVEIEHAERPADQPLPLQVVGAVRRALRESEGDVLVFLPGTYEIRASAEASARCARGRRGLPAALGRAPARRAGPRHRPSARRKVILSTNVARPRSRSPGSWVVIDSGLARVAGHDP